MRLQYSVDLVYDVPVAGTHFVFNVHAARTSRQHIVRENLRIAEPVTLSIHEDADTHSRFLRLRAGQGPLTVHYEAVVDIAHHRAAPASIHESPLDQIPGNVLPYIYPSRYCQSDRLLALAASEFGGLPTGYVRAKAVCDWVASQIKFQNNVSSGSTSACDTLLDRQGVCRDFAHLMIALCRALNMPARFTTGIDYGADPALGPQDFHAYVEVYLAGRWYMFDPSGTAIAQGFVRIGTGRDAADVAFSTIFGAATMTRMRIAIDAVPGQDGRLRTPVRADEALSTGDDVSVA